MMARTKPSRAARRKAADRARLAKLAGIVATLLLLASGCLWLIGAAGSSRTAVIGGPFNLVQGDGRPITDRSFPGKYLLIYFGYTSCEDVCPTTLAKMAVALENLGETGSKVQLLFITVDPERDSPSVVQRYASLFTPKLVGLTGASNEVRKVADEYRVSSAAHGRVTDTGRYAVDHSSVLYLVGPDGRYIAPIRADESGAAMARVIAGHLVP